VEKKDGEVVEVEMIVSVSCCEIGDVERRTLP